ncbi:hypothetical protein D3C87_1373060 [compost metagenome]
MTEEIGVGNVVAIGPRQRQHQHVADLHPGQRAVSAEHILGRTELPDDGPVLLSRRRCHAIPGQVNDRVIVPLGHRQPELMGAAAADQEVLAVTGFAVQHFDGVIAAEGADETTGFEAHDGRIGTGCQAPPQVRAQPLPVELLRAEVIDPQAAAHVEVGDSRG